MNVERVMHIQIFCVSMQSISLYVKDTKTTTMKYAIET